MQVIHKEGSRPIKAWVGQKADKGGSIEHMTFSPDIEEQAMAQLTNLATLPFIAPNGVACMPDVHAGIGSTVGTVIATDKAIIPAAVGVDIGCGMIAVRTDLTADKLPDSLAALRAQIERDVPVGFNQYRREEDIDANWTTRQDMHEAFLALQDEFPEIKTTEDKVLEQLGTLGGGNHFIEICLDTEGCVWIMLHSGSRGTGNAIGRYFIDLAKEEMERYHIKLPDNDLAYLPEGTPLFNDYVKAVHWAQTYAFENRAVMLQRVVAAMRRLLPEFTLTQEAVNCFPADTEVSGLDIKEVFKRPYSGNLITFTFASGQTLRVTPNHPLLTRRGWVAASAFDIGDNLIRATVPDELTTVDEHVERVPSKFSQLFDSLNVDLRSERVFGAAVNFHGDIDPSTGEREVNIVRTNGKLLYGRQTSFFEECRQLNLLGTDLAESSLLGERLLVEFISSDRQSTPPDMGCGSVGLQLRRRELAHADSEDIAAASDNDTCVDEEFSDARCADASKVSQRASSLTSVVSEDKIVNIVVGHWSGHVYNLSSASGWYTADGIINHNCHHNYVERESHFGRNLWVTRKGAIRARRDDLGIIPGSMGQRSYIVRGLGNAESYCSCSHGAGRVMSRTEARKRFTLRDLVEQTEGVECRKDADVIDEIPGAYKKIDEVMANQTDLVEIVHTLKQVLCVKG